MTHPNSRTRRRARDKRANPRRYRLTPAGRAWLERDEALRRATLADELAANNRQALASLRALNNAMIAAGATPPPKQKTP